MADIKDVTTALADLTVKFSQVNTTIKDAFGISVEELLSGNKYGMTFGGAIAALKLGIKVARVGWNGKGMWLYLVTEGKYPMKMNAARAIADEKGDVCYGAYIALKAADGNVYPWNASQADMLSNDWMIVE